MSRLDELNAADDDAARGLLLACLSVPRWADDLLAGRPYADSDSALTRAGSAADQLTDEELEQALSGHPRIGERAGTGHDVERSAREQAGVDSTNASDAERLADANRAYEARFGRVFLIRAAGRSAPEILAELERRLGNDDGTERAETVDNLRQIALLRLRDVV